MGSEADLWPAVRTSEKVVSRRNRVVCSGVYVGSLCDSVPTSSSAPRHTWRDLHNDLPEGQDVKVHNCSQDTKICLAEVLSIVFVSLWRMEELMSRSRRLMFVSAGLERTTNRPGACFQFSLLGNEGVPEVPWGGRKDRLEGRLAVPDVPDCPSSRPGVSTISTLWYTALNWRCAS